VFEPSDVISAIMPWVLHDRLLLTGVCVAFFLMLRFVLLWRVNKREHKFKENTRRWKSNIRNTITVMMVYCVVMIWLSELQEFVFSIAAFFVAIVIAFKEFLLCIVGSLYQTMSRPFSVNDWIQIDDYTGEVVDRDWFSTTLLDIDIDNGSFDFTGKTLEVPNSLFLTQAVKKLHFMRRYVVHRFNLVRPCDVNLFELKGMVLESARVECAHFMDVAERYQQFIQKSLGVTLAGPDPEVRILTNEIGNSVMQVTIFCPVSEAIHIEQSITAVFMREWHLAQQG